VLGLLLAKGSCRFVHDEDPGFDRQGTGDDDEPSFGQREAADLGSRRKSESHQLEHRGGLPLRGTLIHHAEPVRRELAEHDVLGNRERRDDLDLLVDDADTSGLCVRGEVQLDRLPADEELALIR